MDTINPNLWYVCKFCQRAYQLKENLISHKKQEHFSKLKQERKLRKQAKGRRKDNNINNDLHLTICSTNSEAYKSNSGVNIDQVKNTDIDCIAVAVETENLTADEVDADPSAILGARLRSGCDQEQDHSKNTTNSRTISGCAIRTTGGGLIAENDLQLDPAPSPLPLLLSLPPETKSNSSGEDSFREDSSNLSPSYEDVDVQHSTSNGATEELVTPNSSSNDQNCAFDLDTNNFDTPKSRRSSCGTIESGISSVFSENNEVGSGTTTEESDVDMGVSTTGNSNSHEYLEDKVEAETDTLPSTSTLPISVPDPILSRNSNNNSSSLLHTEGVSEIEHISGIGIHERIRNSSQNSGPAKDIYGNNEPTNEISLASVVANLKQRLIPPVPVPDPDLLSRNNSRLSGTAADGNNDFPVVEMTDNLTDQQTMTVSIVSNSISVGRTEVGNDLSPSCFGLMTDNLNESKTDKSGSSVSNLDTDLNENEPSPIISASCLAPTFGSSKSHSFELETFESLKSQSESGSVGLISPDSAPTSDNPSDMFGGNPSFSGLRESLTTPAVSRSQAVQIKPRPKPYGTCKNKKSHLVGTTGTGKSNNVKTSSKTELQAVAALASTISSAHLMLSTTTLIPPAPSAITVETVAESALLTASECDSSQPESAPSLTPAKTVVEDVRNEETPGANVTSEDILTNATNMIEPENNVTSTTTISLGVNGSVDSIFQTSSFKANPSEFDQSCIFGGVKSAGLREDLQTKTSERENRSEVTVEEHTGEGEDILTNWNSRPGISTSTATTHLFNNNDHSSVLSTNKNKQSSLGSSCSVFEDNASTFQNIHKIEKVDTLHVPVPILCRVREIEVIDLDDTDEEVEEEQTRGKSFQKEVGKVPECNRKSKSSKSPAPVKSLNGNQSTETDEYAELRNRIAKNRKRKQMGNPATRPGLSLNSEVEANPFLVSLGGLNTDHKETEKHGNKRQKTAFDPVPSIGVKCIHCSSTCKSTKSYRKHIRKVHGLDWAQNPQLNGTPSSSKATEDQGQDVDTNMDMDIEIETVISSDTTAMSLEETYRKNTEVSVAVEQVELQSELLDPKPTAGASERKPSHQISLPVADVQFPDTSNNTIRSDGGTDFINNSAPSNDKDFFSGSSAGKRIETIAEESTNTKADEIANQVVVDAFITTETDIPMETEAVTDPKTKATPTLRKGIRLDTRKSTKTDGCLATISKGKKSGTTPSKNATNMSSLSFGNNGLRGISSIKNSNLVKQHSSVSNSDTFSESDSTVAVAKLGVAENAGCSGVHLDSEIEVLPPPPPKIPEVIDLLEDTDEDEGKGSSQEIVQEKQHVSSSPTSEKKELIEIKSSAIPQSQNQIQHKVKAIVTNRIERIPKNAAKLQTRTEEIRKNQATVVNRAETNRKTGATVAKRTETNRRNEATVANKTETNRRNESTVANRTERNHRNEVTGTSRTETNRKAETTSANTTGTNRRSEATMKNRSESNLKNKERTENNRNNRKRSQEYQRQRSQSRNRFQNLDERGQNFYEDYDFDNSYNDNNDNERHSTPDYTPSNFDLSRFTCLVCGFIAQSRKELFQHLIAEGHRRLVPRQRERQKPGGAQVPDARIRIQYRRDGGDDPREPQIHDRSQEQIHDRHQQQIYDRRQEQVHDRRQEQVHDRHQEQVHDRHQEQVHDRHQEQVHDRHQEQIDDRRQQQSHDPRQEQNQPQRLLYCTVCDFCATSAGQIHRHQKQVHVGEAMLFRCSVCDFQNWGRTSVKEHVYLVHKVGNYINPTARCISYNMDWV